MKRIKLENQNARKSVDFSKLVNSKDDNASKWITSRNYFKLTMNQ